MDLVEIEFSEGKDVCLRVNHGNRLVKHAEDLTEFERILIRSLQPESDTTIVSDELPFDI